MISNNKYLFIFILTLWASTGVFTSCENVPESESLQENNKFIIDNGDSVVPKSYPIKTFMFFEEGQKKSDIIAILNSKQISFDDEPNLANYFIRNRYPNLGFTNDCPLANYIVLPILTLADLQFKNVVLVFHMESLAFVSLSDFDCEESDIATLRNHYTLKYGDPTITTYGSNPDSLFVFENLQDSIKVVFSETSSTFGNAQIRRSNTMVFFFNSHLNKLCLDYDANMRKERTKIKEETINNNL